MKGKLGMFVLSALMGGMGMVGSRRKSYEPPKRKPIYTPLGNTALIEDVPKGHKTELIEMVFVLGKEEYTFNVMVSYGTQRSRLKRIASKCREIKTYLRRTPDNLLHERAEYVTRKLIEVCP